MFDVEELVNNRIGAYMFFLNKHDQAGFHTHGTRNEQELYVVMHGEGEYMDRVGVTGPVRTQKIKKEALQQLTKTAFIQLKTQLMNP